MTRIFVVLLALFVWAPVERERGTRRISAPESRGTRRVTTYAPAGLVNITNFEFDVYNCPEGEFTTIVTRDASQLERPGSSAFGGPAVYGPSTTTA